MGWSAWASAHERAVRRQAAELTAGCEALVAGRAYEHIAATGREVPAWAWLNVLAHGTRRELADVRSGKRWEVGLGCRREWRAALAFLANEILEKAGPDPAKLVALQSRVLVPLELSLGENPNSRWLGPAELASKVLAALSEHPSNQHGRL